MKELNVLTSSNQNGTAIKESGLSSPVFTDKTIAGVEKRT